MSIIKKNNVVDQKSKSILGLSLAIGAISTAAILIRFAQQSELSSLTIATFRLLLSSLALLPVFLTKNLAEVKKAISFRTGLFIFISGIFLALHFYSWVSSLEFTNVISSVVLVTTTPIWVSIISVLLLREKIGYAFWTGLLIAMIGTLVISGFESGNILLTANQKQITMGNLLALIGAWCASGYVIIGKKVRQTLSTSSYIFLVYTCAGLILLAIAVVFRQPLSVAYSDNWLWLILLALVPQLIGHSLINWALGILPATKVSIALLGEPVGASLLAFLFLNEAPSLNEVIGGLLILTGIYLALISDKEKLDGGECS